MGWGAAEACGLLVKPAQAVEDRAATGRGSRPHPVQEMGLSTPDRPSPHPQITHPTSTRTGTHPPRASTCYGQVATWSDPSASGWLHFDGKHVRVFRENPGTAAGKQSMEVEFDMQAAKVRGRARA